ncbi:MAG: exopolysaccharide biosynthesis polyprenyl glycosylphosphotransferase [Oscillospiraceae bacterium]|nr:exopolysaccharide biosynthesis polyprenyl glycosylphosphotransferase [Oscillospiraceae bacterium]
MLLYISDIVGFYTKRVRRDTVETKVKDEKLTSAAQVETKKRTGGKEYLLVKRLFDIVFALTTGIVLLIPMIIIGILVKLDSKGPAIYSQERLGLNGKPFVMYKFRSMRMDAEEAGPQWAQKDDERCTKFGKFLRKTRLDELPQAINILTGNMSVVGPRPERAYFYDEFEKNIPNFRQRLQVKPGLTGYAQVNGGYDLLPEEKLAYDLEYIEKRSLWLDLSCIVKTVRLIFTHEGAR